ncbi:MAG: RNA 2',3'-cyclic phosphodiesterase [Deltaproteobacteria bacterium]|nr:RNA 2',3'-cyclic phosphodiesterase [Deltaproteobacteria bacterium]
MDGKKPLRAFVAIKLPIHIIEELARLKKKLVDYGIAARWVRPENIHLTLRFLGDIPADSVAPVLTRMKIAADGIKPINLSVCGMGVFPNIKRAQVIWVGLGDESGLLADLNRRLESELDKIGFAPEKRRFAPHLTLGRIKKPVSPEALADALGEKAVFSPVPFTAQLIYLIESRLTKNGPIYTDLDFVEFCS